MLAFFIDNIFVVVCWNSHGYELCPFVSGPVFAFIWSTIYSKACTWQEKSLAVAFNSTFRYIDDVLSINNNQFHTYVDSIYPYELEIKDTIVFHICYVILLKFDTNGKLTTQLYDKRDDFNISIVIFSYLLSNIPILPAHGVYISQLIRYARAYSTYDQFLIRGSVLTNKLMSQRFLQFRLQAAFSKFYGCYNDLLCQYNLS
jgi:hypothetical protein